MEPLGLLDRLGQFRSQNLLRLVEPEVNFVAAGVGSRQGIAVEIQTDVELLEFARR